MINVGLVGFGKIARDQHLPALAADPNFRVVAITEGTSPAPRGVTVHHSIHEMIRDSPNLHAITLCTPPQGRHALARFAIDHGLHVMMEKPPGQSLSEVEDLVAAAKRRSVALFATWHSRCAPAVEAARAWLAVREIREVSVTWKEDVRRWHPGQSWIWQAGGLGVFDPGINALSIVTRILPRPIFLADAELFYPSNRGMPIAARLAITDSLNTPIRIDLDWRQTGLQCWDIAIRTGDALLSISEGGSKMFIDEKPIPLPPEAEYANLYKHLGVLVESRQVDVDLAPFRLVADAFMLGRRQTVSEFLD